MLVMLILIGVAGKNVGPNAAQLNTVSPAPSNTRPVKNYQLDERKFLAFGIRLGSEFGGPVPRASEPHSREVPLDGVYRFLFRFALVAAILLLALLMVYLAR